MILGCALFLASCGVKQQNGVSSQMSITFPTVAEQRLNAKSDVSALDYDFARACFAINVTASDIESKTSGTCDIPTGVFVGFVAPGESVNVSVPHGTGRKLEIFAFQRTGSGDPCPDGRQNLSGLDLTRLSRVGLVSSFDALASEVNLDVSVSVPTQTIAKQYSMPNECQPKAKPPLTPSAIAVARGVQSGGKFKAVVTVSGLKNETTLTGGAYRARLSRMAQ